MVLTRTPQGRRDERGSALLLVVGASAAIGVLATAVLGAALAAYRIAALEQQGQQARVLASSALEALAPRVASGAVTVPTIGAHSTWGATVPRAYRSSPDCRFEVRLSVAVDAAGGPLRDSGAPPAALYDAVAEGRCGRGLSIRRGRLAIAADGGVARLY